MRIAAIYVKEHGYLFDKPQTINFGTRYFYSFKQENKDILVSKVLNNNFIADFFDLTKLTSKLTNINAIVGQNGAGKSTILDIVRSEFVKYNYAFPHVKSLFLAEIDEVDEPVLLRNDFGKVFFADNKLELDLPLKGKIQTIYYSPHYDYKYNPNFDDVDSHDISFDRILEKDLEEMADKDTNENGWPYSASQELIFKNSLRQITFLSSDLVKNQNIFKNLFQLQEHYEPILHFRGYTEKDREWNTPYGLRKILKLIADKAEKESLAWHEFRDSGATQVQVRQYLLKRNVVKSVVSLLWWQMEKHNTFLQEGSFPYEKLEKELEGADSYRALILFGKHSLIEPHVTAPKTIFSENLLENLLSEIFSAIEKAADEDSVSNGTLKTSTEDAIRILNLQRHFLNELNSYYSSGRLIRDREKVEEFVNYMPFSRRMSSGETALLNFYSRIYDFLNSNLKEPKSRELKEHYILLLDEADLTFHPSWKKKYVKALVKTLPYFFNELETKPSIEIVFTTHDPLTLSDLPNTNVIYIERPDYNSPSNILDYNEKNRPCKTFGANISDLIADSFFIENSLIGDFAFDKINDTIEWLNREGDKSNWEYHKKLIQIIDEPIVQRKLAEMYDDKMQTNFQAAIIEEQILKLTELKNRLK